MIRALFVATASFGGVLGLWAPHSAGENGLPSIDIPSEPQFVPDSYIIRLRDDNNGEAVTTFSETLFGLGIEPKYNYSIGSFKGFAVKLEPNVAVHLESHPSVAAIEKEVIAHLQVDSSNPQIGIALNDNRCSFFGCEEYLETGAPWGLGRLSHRSIQGPSALQEYPHYYYGGKDTTVYLLDTGIYVDHSEFEQRDFFSHPGSRALSNLTFVKEPEYDINGHGTHCAGTIGGHKYGIAKMTNIVSAKICSKDGTCELSNILAGLEFAVLDHQKRLAADPENYRGSVVSMSLSAPAAMATSLTIAASAAVLSGLVVVAAAGNENADACLSSPACSPEVIAVGASTYDNKRASFSNYGTCVNIFAPGQSVLSASLSGRFGSTIGSGTSMATPHVAGLSAYYLSLAESNLAASPRDLRDFLLSVATTGELLNVGKGSPNVLAYSGAFGADA